MGTRLNLFLEYLRNSFWFIPALMTVGTTALAFFMIWLDQQPAEPWFKQISYIYSGGPDGAREVLSTIAGSMITVAGVVFSVTVVVLTLATSQFGPQVLRMFLGDRGNQFVLGTFVSTFVYCLIVLRSVSGNTNNGGFVPHLGVTGGVALALLSLAVLIYFIHHIARSIEVNHLVTSIGNRLDVGLQRAFPERVPERVASDESWLEGLEERFRHGMVLSAVRAGHVQAVDVERLVELAREWEAVIRCECRPGHFLIENAPLATVVPAQAADELQRRERIQRCFEVGADRTQNQDVEYAVEQLVQIASRALSPSLNDPHTAMICIDHLAAALARIARRPEPSPYRFDKEGYLRVILKQSDFAGVVDAAFNQIRQYGAGHPSVVIRLLDRIADLGRQVERPEHRQVLLRHAEMILRAAGEQVQESNDRRDIEQRYQRVRQCLSTGPRQEPRVA